MKKASFSAMLAVCAAVAAAIVFHASQRRTPKQRGLNPSKALGDTDFRRQSPAASSPKPIKEPPSSASQRAEHVSEIAGSGARGVAEGTAASRETSTTAPSSAEPVGGPFSSAVTSLLAKLSQSGDRTELRKAAKALGDRCIAGGLVLSEEQRQAVADLVVDWLRQSKSRSSHERTEARQQIERLWLLAAPTLIEHVDSRDPTVAELAIKSLILMRNKTIAESLIGKARSATDEHTRVMVIFALSKFKEQRSSLIPGRECLNEEQSRALCDEVIAPAINDLRQ